MKENLTADFAEHSNEEKVTEELDLRDAAYLSGELIGSAYRGCVASGVDEDIAIELIVGLFKQDTVFYNVNEDEEDDSEEE